MANCYVVTAQKATAVSDCITGNFTSPSDLNLLVSKNDRIEIFSVKSEGLKAIKEISIYGKIAVMKFFRIPNDLKDSLLVVTHKFNIMILACDGGEENFKIVTKATGNVSDRIGRPSETGIIAIIDPDTRLIGLRMYDGLFKIIPLNPTCTDLRAYSIRMEEPEVFDIQFLYGCASPTVLVVYQDTNGRHVKALEVSMKDKEFLRAPWKQDNVDTEANMAIAVPEPIGGAIVIGRETIAYLNGDYSLSLASNHMKEGLISCCSRMDYGTRYLLGNMNGKLYMLMIVLDPVGAKVRKMVLECLGETTIPEAITYLDNGYVYIGSKFGDSQLIRLNAVADAKGSFLTIIDTYTNLGPIFDMCVVDLEHQGQGQLITCSGGNKEGSLRIIRNGIGINEHASIDIPGIKGIWSLCAKAEGTSYHKVLALSFVAHTRLVLLNADEVEETDIAGFATDVQTLYCNNLEKTHVLQVTTDSIRIIGIGEEKGLVSEWSPAKGKKISIVSCNECQIACASGPSLYYLEVVKPGMEVFLLKEQQLENDVSSVDISPIFEDCENEMGGGKSHFVAVGLWTSMSVRILNLPDLVEVHSDKLGGDTVARSLLMITFEGISYLLCALGDGSMFYFNMNAITGALIDKKKVILGTQAIELRVFRSFSTFNVFACSDRPTVVYSSNNKLVFSNVNLKQVNHMCSVDTEIYPDSLALVTPATVVIGTMDEIQKLHIRTIPLGEQPRRISYQEFSQTFGVISIRVEKSEKANNSNAMEIGGSGGSTSSTPYCASLMAQSCSHAAFTSTALKNAGTLPTEVGVEVEVHNVLIIDQHTFEILHAHSFPPNEYAMSLISGQFGDDPAHYYVVGTALVNPDETEPKLGRILFLTWLENKLTQVTEKEVKGCVYSLAPFNGKLLASVNSTVRLFEWTTDRELRIECSHFNNIMALYVKPKGDYLLIGDLMRSLAVLQHKSLEGSFEEVCRDYSANWTTAVEIMDDDLFLGAESQGNLYVCQRDTTGTSEEAKHHMEQVGLIHIGDMVNVFQHGSLVMKMSGDAPTPTHGGIVYGTLNGAIGMITQVTPYMFDFLQLLQQKLSAVIKSVGKIDHSFWRSYDSCQKSENMEGFIDGDLVEKFLDLSAKDMEEVVDSMRGTEQVTNLSNDPYIGTSMQSLTVGDVSKLVEDFTRIH